MALLKSISEIKQHVLINKNMNYDSIKPFIDQCELVYIIPSIGQDLYDEINTPHSIGYPLSAENALLLPYIQRALAYYALGESAPFLNIMIGEMGIQEQNSKDGTSGPSRQWSYNNLVKGFFRNADLFADSMLKFMEDNKSSYPLWANDPAAYTITKSLFINSASELSEYVNIFGSRRTYKAIRPFIDLAERKYITPAICQGLFDDLKSKILSGYRTADDDKIINLIKRTLAYFSMLEAVPHLSLEVSSQGVRLVSFNDGNVSKAPAVDNVGGGNIPVGAYMRSLNSNGETFLSELKKYLEDNADTIALYKESTCYTCQHKNPMGTLPDNINKPDFWT